MQKIPRRKILFIVADIILIAFSVFLAFVVRFEGPIPERYLLNVWGLIVSATAFTLPIFYLSRLYSFSWSYVSTSELIALARATSLSFLLLTATFFILRDHAIFSGFPRSTLFISYFFIFIFAGGIRFLKRIYVQLFHGGGLEKRERTLIVGAGDAGEQILRSIFNFRKSPYFPVGFVDDGQVKQGTQIHGLKVLGKLNDIPAIVRSNKIESLIIALPSIDKRVIKQTVELGRKAGLKKMKITPSVGEIIDGKVSIGQLREVEGVDLLNREQVSLDLKVIESFICSKTVLITGAAGSIGSELCRQIARFDPSLILIIDQDETGIFNISKEMFDKFPKIKIEPFVGDIIDEKKLDWIFKEFSPKIVFHAAAYKHVPLMENEPEEAVKNNICGTKKLAEVAKKYGTEKFIFISTDKAVKPTSVMGTTKRVGEMICRSLNNGTKFISVRFGNVLDSRGSVIPIFREQIRSGGPVEVTHPGMKRYFMTTSEACLLVMRAATMGKGGEVFVLDMGKPIRILDLAKEMIKLSGKEPDKDIPIVFTGMRPGEKLFEEFLSAEDGTVATQNQKIFVANLSEINIKKLNEDLEKMKKLLDGGEKKDIIKLLKKLVPTYHESIYKN
ncbi:polysaccharide biosynthesis protein [Patescibacteria group bacterium]